ncbi:unnamed protein product [Adineta ricciae]|uniref:Uncharacterized protein n=1 Tax=Adineta ricciae TaxID=249248 RepID=A0A816B5X5_ADIRI|nr:unnamed protein product [Adineta ricciae]
MLCLEDLTLFLDISSQSPLIYGTYLTDEILFPMSQLQAFIFCIECLEDVRGDVSVHPSTIDIQQSFADFKYGQVSYMVDYVYYPPLYRVFSLPTKFQRLTRITNNIPDMIFDSVTHVELHNENAFKHEFFVRLAKAFPFLKTLSIHNMWPPFLREKQYHLCDKDWCSMIEYRHLSSLDMTSANSYYLKHFLNQTKTRLPSLSKLKVHYYLLKAVTNNFAKEEMRHNCCRVKQLVTDYPRTDLESILRYFPSLLI